MFYIRYVLSVRCVMHYYPPLGDRGVGPRVASPVIRVKRIPDIPPFLQPQIGLLFPDPLPPPHPHSLPPPNPPPPGPPPPLYITSTPKTTPPELKNRLLGS